MKKIKCNKSEFIFKMFKREKISYLIIILVIVINITTAQNTLELEWVREYTGDFEVQEASGLAVDDSGNVIVGITSFDTISNDGITLQKYNTNGDLLWMQKYEGDFEPGNSISNDKLQDITIDNNNNIYLAGRSDFCQSDPYEAYTSFLTFKYNSNGEILWLSEFTIDTLRTGWYWPYTIAVDSSNNVYVGGNFEKGIILKYNSSGNLVWKTDVDFTTYIDNMLLDEYSNIYIYKSDIGCAKYDSNGVLQWKTITDSLNEGVGAIGMTIDNDRNIYLTGIKKYNRNTAAIYTAKYNQNGIRQWIKKYGGEEYYYYVGNHIFVDNHGNSYISGHFFSSSISDNQFITIKYDSSGNEIWVNKFDGPSNTSCQLFDMAMDNKNSVYITGRVYNSYIDHLVLVKYDTNGDLLYEGYYVESSLNTKGHDIEIDNNNNVFLIGESWKSGLKTIVLKYIQTPLSGNETNNIIPHTPRLNQNYPNPFNSSTSISYYLPKNMYVNITIYDLLGRKIKRIVDEKKQAGNYKFTFITDNLSSGIYIYRLQADEFNITRKLLLIK